MAFDAKPFERGNPPSGGESSDRGSAGVFKTQLGVGVATGDKEAFKERLTSKFAGVRDALKPDGQLPVCSSSRLR